ncbi:MAG: ParB/RepB/Spo0J family partition protein [Bacteroidales bacterium]|jgi:ParB family chromosome partitioning protein|nr:ParB/RepB/Spo0J family partition protein [Bacteroidales bacterium]
MMGDTKKSSKPALGKGLGSILGGNADTVLPETSRARVMTDSVSMIPVSAIDARTDQPRKHFDEALLEELANSIRNMGVITPVTVRPLEGGRYQLIAGERRLRASKIAGLQEIPSYVRTANELEVAQMALVENIQRTDLNAIEIAVSYQRLLDEFNLTHEYLSEKVGKQRSTVTNYIRLLKLFPEAQVALRDNQITMGHARALIPIEDRDLQAKIVRKIIKDGLSVRQVEQLISKYTAVPEDTAKTKKINILPQEIEAFKNQFSQKLHVQVAIDQGHSGKGKITIPFASESELQHLIRTIAVMVD